MEEAHKAMEESQRAWEEAQRAYEQAQPLVEAVVQAQPRLETLLTLEERRVLGCDPAAFAALNFPVWVEVVETDSTPEQRKLANAKAYTNLQRVVRALKCKLAPGLLPMSYQLDTKDGMHFIVDPHYIHRCVPGDFVAYYSDKTCYQVYPQCPGAEKVATALLQLNRNSSYFDFLKNRPGEYVS